MSLPASSSAILGRERKLALSAASPGMPSKGGPELTIVVPTLNERDNVGPLIDRLDRLLVGVDWEAVFVDDNSADNTAERLRDLGRTDRRIRCIRRFGRRGLSSACIEGDPVDFSALHRGHRRRSSARRNFAAAHARHPETGADRSRCGEPIFGIRRRRRSFHKTPRVEPRRSMARSGAAEIRYHGPG